MEIEDYAALISEKATQLIDKYFDDIVEQATNKPNKPFVIPRSDIRGVIDEIVIANEGIRQKAVDDFGPDTKQRESKRSKKEFDQKIEFYVVKNLEEGINRIHSAQIARQVFDNERPQKTIDAADRTKKLLVSVAITEIAASYALFHESTAIENDWEFFRYSTVQDQVVRPAHNEREGKIFVFGRSRTVDDVPLLAPHCRCFAFPLTAEEAAAGEFYYPEDRQYLPGINAKSITTAESQGKNDLKYQDMDDIQIFARKGEVVIDVVGPIDDWSNNDYASFREKVESYVSETDKIVINITSNGGNVLDSFSSYDFLKGLSNHITANIYGYVASAATHFTSAADVVTMGENDLYLIHNSWACPCGTKEELKDYIQSLDEADKKQIEIYQAKTNMNKKEIVELMLEDRTLTAKEAKKLGFVDSVRKDSKRSRTARESISACANLKSLNEVLEMTVENKDDLQAQIKALEEKLEAEKERALKAEAELDIEKSKAAIAIKAANESKDSAVTEAEVYAKIKAEVEKEISDYSKLKEEISDLGFDVVGDNTESLLVNTIQAAGGSTENLNMDALKSVYASIKGIHGTKKASDEHEGINSSNERNISSISDYINEKRGAA